MGGHYRLLPPIKERVHSSLQAATAAPPAYYSRLAGLARVPLRSSVVPDSRWHRVQAHAFRSVGQSRPISPALSRKGTGLHFLSETHADMGFGKDQGGLVQSPVLSCIHSFHLRDQPHPLSRGGLPFPFALLLGHGDGGRKSHAPSRSRRLRAIDGNPVYLVVKGAPHITTRGTLPRSANHGASRFPRQEE